MIPSGYVKIAIENGHLVRGFTHWKWWFSIATLVYQRVSWEMGSLIFPFVVMGHVGTVGNCCWSFFWMNIMITFLNDILLDSSVILQSLLLKLFISSKFLFDSKNWADGGDYPSWGLLGVVIAWPHIKLKIGEIWWFTWGFKGFSHCKWWFNEDIPTGIPHL